MKRGAKAFWDERLTAYQNKIVEMARNGYCHPEIADEMLTSRESVAATITRIRRAFPDIKIPPSRRLHPEQDRLERLFAKGLKVEQIAEITGKRPGTVTVWRYRLRTSQD